MSIGYALAVAGPGDGWGHMGNGGWSGWMWLWAAAMVFTWILVIGTAAWLVVGATGRNRLEAVRPARTGLDRARVTLAERYARGEISTEEYDERLARLRIGSDHQEEL